MTIPTTTAHPDLLGLGSEQVPVCTLCGTTGIVDSRWNLLLALPPSYGVLYCRGCSLRWLSPRPTEDGYRQIYSDENYFGGEGVAPEDYQVLARARIPYYASRLKKIESIQVGMGLAILDYGAATGDFVHLARARGHRCDGVELSDDARSTALKRYGFSLLSAEQASRLEKGSYDVVHMNHVLEHMPDPLAHMRWCHGLLKAGGLLIVEVPQQFDNDLDRMRRLLGFGGRQKRFDAYSLHHTFFFGPDSLEAFSTQVGFVPLWVRTFNPAKTPLWPPFWRHWLLRAWLGLADKLHQGGNIIELFAIRSDRI